MTEEDPEQVRSALVPELSTLESLTDLNQPSTSTGVTDGPRRTVTRPISRLNSRARQLARLQRCSSVGPRARQR